MELRRSEYLDKCIEAIKDDITTADGNLIMFPPDVGGYDVAGNPELKKVGNKMVLTFYGKNNEPIAQFDLVLSDPHCPVEDKSADIKKVWV